MKNLNKKNEMKYATIRQRLFHYFPLKVNATVMLLSIGMLYIVAPVDIFFFASILFLSVLFLNAYIFKKRAQYYITSFEANNNGIQINYIYGDNTKSIQSSWENFNYYFGSLRGDLILVLWVGDVQILTAFRSFGNHKIIFPELSKAFQLYIEKHRINKTSSFTFILDFPLTYTKNYKFKIFS